MCKSSNQQSFSRGPGSLEEIGTLHFTCSCIPRATCAAGQLRISYTRSNTAKVDRSWSWRCIFIWYADSSQISWQHRAMDHAATGGASLRIPKCRNLSSELLRSDALLHLLTLPDAQRHVMSPTDACLLAHGDVC